MQHLPIHRIVWHLPPMVIGNGAVAGSRNHRKWSARAETSSEPTWLLPQSPLGANGCTGRANRATGLRVPWHAELRGHNRAPRRASSTSNAVLEKAHAWDERKRSRDCATARP
jgi:hypothetical protein